MIGQHLMVDGVFEPPLNREKLEAILSELPRIIGMHILHGPEVDLVVGVTASTLERVGRDAIVGPIEDPELVNQKILNNLTQLADVCRQTLVQTLILPWRSDLAL